MSENIVIYVGVNIAGKMKKQAVENEAKRQERSVSALIWDMFKTYGSPKLKKELITIEKLASQENS